MATVLHIALPGWHGDGPGRRYTVAMIDLADMPDDIRDLVRLELELPRLDPDNESEAPVALADAAGRLNLALPSSDWTFCRTARVEDRDYWVWRGPIAGRVHYLAVWQKDNGDLCCVAQACAADWTPEQFIAGEYHNYFYDHWNQQYTLRYPPSGIDQRDTAGHS